MNVRQWLGRLQRMRGFAADIDVQYVPTAVEMTRALPCIVGLRNTGSEPWRAGGAFPVALSYHWRQGDAAIEGRRFPLPGDIAPTQEAVIDCAVFAPAQEGDYTLEFDLVREHVGWFRHFGSSPASVTRRVHDYDYLVSYAHADLATDYWTIVGPTSREQYEHLGRHKRQQLIELGLTPHSRILDIGCGTGQLAETLVDYLRDDGRYVGTDLAPQAIAFCVEKFRRANFSFRVNPMTGVDAGGQQFDIIYLSSVFTHMYPPEIKAMLIDLKQAMAPGGLIMADVFVSPHANPVMGSRSKVEINESYLMSLIADTGLRHQQQGCIVQPAGGKRLGLVFRNPAAPAKQPATRG